MERAYRLVVSCPGRVGIVAAVSDFIAGHQGWITEAHYYADPVSQWFFMRYVVRADSLPFGLERFRALFGPIAARFGMHWCLTDTGVSKRVVLMASKQFHCLSDLL
jgi:formyltetrahydrofolate deformylase